MKRQFRHSRVACFVTSAARVLAGEKKRSQKILGFSIMEALIGLGALSIVALGAAGVSLLIQKSQQQEIAQQTYNSLIRRLSFTLKTGVALRRSADVIPGNIPYDAYPPNGNKMLLDCLRDDGDQEMDTCFHWPPPPYSRPLDDQYDTRRFILVDPLGNTVHPNTTAYWTMDGRLCDGQNGNPPYDPLKPETCPFITNVRFAAYCNAGDTAGTRCSIARAFKFYYTVEMTTAKISGVAPLPRYDSLINDPIYYTLGELLRMSIALPSDCDYANGYAITGFNADGTLQCGKVSAQVTPLAIHSFTSSQPSCQFSVRKSGATSDVTMEFPSLLPPSQGFHYVSFGGVWMEQNTGTAMDLGKPESCTTNYDPAAYYYSIGTEHFQNSYMISQCNGSGNSSNLQCTAKNDGMFSMWLAALNTSIPNDSMLRSAGMMANNMSHCNVCEIPGPLLVVHDFNEVHSDVAPNCPSGWDRLYTGRSLGGFSLDANDNDAGYAAMTDLSSPGSCVRLPSGFTHHRTPFIECKHFSTGSGDSERIGCSYDTGSDYSLWFTRSGGQAYQCSVCYKPAQMMVQ